MADALLGFTLNDANVGAMTEAFSAVIAGSARVVNVDALSITDRLSAPATADLLVRGFTPAAYSDVKLYNGGTGGVVIFGGTAVSVGYNAVRLGDDPWHTLTCQDYTWLLNRYKRVNAKYTSIGVNTCLTRLLADFTDGGFRVGYCPASLGDVWEVTFSNASVTDAIDELARIAGGFWDVDGDKRVHIFDSPAHLSDDSITLDGSSKNFAQPTVTTDGSDIATRVYVLGDSSNTTAVVASGATEIPVEDVTPFVGASSSAGTVLVNEQVLTYTDVSVRSGPGNLTGVATISADLPQGASVRVRAMAEDATAQSDLATLLGGGLSGLAELTIESDANVDMAQAIADAELAKRKSLYKSLTYLAYDQTHTDAANTVPGQTVSVSLTAPTTVSGTFRVQEVQMSVREGGKLAGSTLAFQRRVTCAPYFRGLNTARRL